MPNQRQQPSRELAERELRLRELTDQSLQLLDQLAQSRRDLEELRDEVRDVAQEREDLRQQLGQLGDTQIRTEEALADARRRVRSSRSLRSVGRPGGDPATVDLVYWLPGQGRGAPIGVPSVDAEALAKAVVEAVAVGFRCSLICPPDLPLAALQEIPELSLIAADGDTPGQAFNLAMASTEAPTVWLMVVGATTDAAGRQGLLGLDDESNGLGIPRLEAADGESSLGLVETALLVLARAAVTDVDPESRDCSFAAPEAFLVQRAAFQRVGLFDQSLIGPAVLSDYCLRVRREGFRLFALPDCRVQLAPGLDLLAEMCRDRDRMIIIARYRHDELSVALAKSETIWDRPAAELEPLVDALFSQLPGATPAGTALYVHQLRSLLQGAVPEGEVRERYREICDALQELHGISCQHVSPRLGEVFHELEASAVEDRKGRHRDVWAESMLARIRLELEIKGALAQAHDALTEQAAELSEQVHARDGQVEDLTAGLADRDAQLVDREAQLQELYRGVADRDGQLQGLEATRVELEATRVESETARSELRASLAEQSAAQSGQAEARRHLAAALELGCRQMAAAQRVDPESSMESLSQHAQEISATLAERNQWILALLDELVAKRFRLRPRPLAPHEQEFLELHRGGNGPSDE